MKGASLSIGYDCNMSILRVKAGDRIRNDMPPRRLQAFVQQVFTPRVAEMLRLCSERGVAPNPRMQEKERSHGATVSTSWDSYQIENLKRYEARVHHAPFAFLGEW